MQNLEALELIATIIHAISGRTYFQETPGYRLHTHLNRTIYFRPNMVFMSKLSLPTIKCNTLKQMR